MSWLFIASVDMNPLRKLTVVVLSSLFIFKVCSEEFISQTIRGSVGAGNYTYYRLTMMGDILLLLKTVEGDCDIYVSQEFLHPTYELDKHCLQSTTCGPDHVLIPAEFRRPVGIGIYGHPSHEFSRYELKVVLNTTPKERDYYNFAEEESDYSEYDRTEHPHIPTVIKDDEESLLWSIFIGLLRLLLEILT